MNTTTTQDLDALIAAYAPMGERIIAAMHAIQAAPPTTDLDGRARGARVAAVELRNHLRFLRAAFAAQVEEAR
jgi:hypothetical protein